jgi:hypothetical protein
MTGAGRNRFSQALLRGQGSMFNIKTFGSTLWERLVFRNSRKMHKITQFRPRTSAF